MKQRGAQCWRNSLMVAKRKLKCHLLSKAFFDHLSKTVMPATSPSPASFFLLLTLLSTHHQLLCYVFNLSSLLKVYLLELECKLWENRDFCLFCSLLYPQYLRQCHDKYWLKEVRWISRAVGPREDGQCIHNREAKQKNRDLRRLTGMVRASTRYVRNFR